MRRVMFMFAGLVSAASLGLIVAFGITAISASAHQSGCHAAHTCPSDHHTYIWYDGSGQGWDCAQPGAKEYDPSRDTTVITWDSRTYFCRAAGGTQTTMTASTTTAPVATSQTSTATSTDPPTTAPEPPPPSPGVKCGSERWDVKTLSGPNAAMVDFAHVTPRTVESLRGLPDAHTHATTPRDPDGSGVELTVYRVKATLVVARIEGDRDIHLVIRGKTKTATMIVEFPSAVCKGTASSVRKAQIQSARAALVSSCRRADGKPPSFKNWTYLSGTATLDGVGFFDLKHPRPQRGVAKNNIELHPVLRFASSGCRVIRKPT